MDASRPRIAVLGAGPMGLAAAYQLALDGARPVLFEAADRLGGMTATFDFGGIDIERYYHFHCISDHAFLQVLNELGLANRMRWVETRMGYWFEDRLQAWGNPLALLKFRGLSLVSKARAAVHALACIRRRDWQPLDSREAISWIRRWVGEEAYEVLWRRLFEYKFYDYAHGLSAAWIWSRIRRIGRSRYNLMREKLGYLEGGSSTLLNGLREVIEANGGEIRLSTPVHEVVFEAGAVKGLRTESGFESYDRIISTVPLPYIPAMMPGLPEELRRAFESVHNIAVVCVIAKLKKQVTPNFWINTNDPEMDIPGLVEYTNLRPLENHIVYVPFYLPREHPNYRDSDEVFIGKVKSYLKKINSSLSDSDFIEVRVNRHHHAQPICHPQFLSTLPPAKLPIGGLWVADTSYYYPEDRGISESIAFGRRLAQEAIR